MEGSGSVQITDLGGPKTYGSGTLLIIYIRLFSSSLADHSAGAGGRGLAAVGGGGGGQGWDRFRPYRGGGGGAFPHYEGNNRGGRVYGDVVIKHLNRKIRWEL